MNAQQIGIANLIRSAVTGEALPLPADFDLAEAYRQLARHQITELACSGGLRCGLSKEEPVMQKLFFAYCAGIQRDELQQRALERIFSAFEAAEIDHMPLKGCNLKKLYPCRELRRMGDADILIRETQYKAAGRILQEQGYQPGVLTDNTYSWKTPALLVELHIRPISRAVADLYPYFGDGWSRAVKQQGHCYGLSPEDEYLFILAHFAKHYRSSGIGIRQLTDLWILRRTYSLDERYLGAELQKLHMERFHANLLRTLNAWFEGGEEDEITQLITDYIYESGSWGSQQAYALSNGVELQAKKGTGPVKLRTLLYILFPPAVNIANAYPALEKYPALLPFFWMVRGWEIFRLRRKNIGIRLHALRAVTPEGVKKRANHMEKVGLGYFFENLDK
ncbi:MAG: nucleotidyltransferase family protein [Clostridia bacterium]|nr:nucleotidyltransferase family protein [Clostridia bacterium]